METKKEESFHQEKDNVLLKERVQKITEALYRVSELFSDKEPLKWQLRNNALEIFDYLIFVENKEKTFGAENIFNLIRKMESVLQLSSSSTAYFSSINFEILRREYVSLSEIIANYFENKKREADSLSSIKNFLPFSQMDKISDSNGQDISNRHISSEKITDNGHNGQIEKELSIKENKEPELQKESIKDESLIILEQTNKEQENGHNFEIDKGHPALLKERKNKILSTIKQGQWMNIREIAALLPLLGEKSIQRDLLEMVEAGILKKIGDKRWRKYSLS